MGELSTQKGGATDLYLIRLGAVQTGGGWEPLLLVGNFQRPKRATAYHKMAL
jgi:hypothetical protein